MKIPTLLLAEVRDDDRAACGMCPDLFAGHPLMCLRFGDTKCVELVRGDDGHILRCDECLAAESAHLRALEPVDEAVELLELVEAGVQISIPGHVSFVCTDAERIRMLDFVKAWKRRGK